MSNPTVSRTTSASCSIWALPATGKALKGLQSQAPLKEKFLDILLFVVSYQDASGDFLLVPCGCRPGEGDSQAGKGSAVVLQEVCTRTEVSRSLLTWPGGIKLDVGVRLPSSELHCPGSRREGGKHEQQQGSRGGKRRGETWKLPSRTAPKGESGTGMRGKRFARVFLPWLLGMLFLFLLCRERHAAAFISGWSLSVFLARDSV